MESYATKQLKPLFVEGDTTDPRIVGLWSIICNRVNTSLITQNEFCRGSNENMVFNLFHKDPIAYDLMSSIIKLNSKPVPIIIRKITTCFESQKISDIQKVLSKHSKAKLILCHQSEFAIVLSKHGRVIDLFVWKLADCS